MHYTLHLTDDCNMACRYCYVKHNTRYMSKETARAAVDLAAKSMNPSGIVFFGGEPLLCRDVLCDTVEYADRLAREGKGKFYYKITTNGLLLDDVFLNFAEKYEIFIALSHDGVRKAHDKNRIKRDGSGTFDKVEEAARRLLERRPYSPVMMTVSPDTVMYYAEGVRHLYNLGFRYIICSLDYSGDWSDESLEILRRQYHILADYYRELTLAEEKFYLSPFEVKISSHIHKDTYCSERCELGKKQLSVSPDGGLYPCVQFVGEVKYRVGDVFQGVDEKKRLALYLENENERESCRDCAVRLRCNHHCACLNKQATGDFRVVSPVLCAHERILLPIADSLAEELYKKRSAIFIHKHYNDMFPLLSLTEDRLN